MTATAFGWLKRLLAFAFVVTAIAASPAMAQDQAAVVDAKLIQLSAQDKWAALKGASDFEGRIYQFLKTVAPKYAKQLEKMPGTNACIAAANPTDIKTKCAAATLNRAFPIYIRWIDAETPAENPPAPPPRRDQTTLEGAIKAAYAKLFPADDKACAPLCQPREIHEVFKRLPPSTRGIAACVADRNKCDLTAIHSDDLEDITAKVDEIRAPGAGDGWFPWIIGGAALAILIALLLSVKRSRNWLKKLFRLDEKTPPVIVPPPPPPEPDGRDKFLLRPAQADEVLIEEAVGRVLYALSLAAEDKVVNPLALEKPSDRTWTQIMDESARKLGMAFAQGRERPLLDADELLNRQSEFRKQFEQIKRDLEVLQERARAADEAARIAAEEAAAAAAAEELARISPLPETDGTGAPPTPSPTAPGEEQQQQQSEEDAETKTTAQSEEEEHSETEVETVVEEKPNPAPDAREDCLYAPPPTHEIPPGGALPGASADTPAPVFEQGPSLHKLDTAIATFLKALEMGNPETFAAVSPLFRSRRSFNDDSHMRIVALFEAVQEAAIDRGATFRTTLFPDLLREAGLDDVYVLDTPATGIGTDQGSVKVRKNEGFGTTGRVNMVHSPGLKLKATGEQLVQPVIAFN